jgi:hypothetical protein
VAEVKQKIFELCEGFKDRVTDGYIAEFFAEDKSGGTSGAIKSARTMMKNWDRYEIRVALSPGKDLIGKISNWSKKKFNVSFGVSALLREIRAGEIAEELRVVLAAIEDNEPFQ